MDGDGADFGELEDLLLDGHGHCTGGGEFLPPMNGMVPGFYAGDDGLRAVALLDGGEGDGVGGEECAVALLFHACGVSCVMYSGRIVICVALGRLPFDFRICLGTVGCLDFLACHAG